MVLSFAQLKSYHVDIWGIKTDAVSLFFLPEGVLWYKDDRYRAISYGSLNVAYRPCEASRRER